MSHRILILSSMYPNSKIYLSGIFVHEQVKALKELGYNITVIAPIPISPWFLGIFMRKWKLYREIPILENIESVSVYHPRYFALPNGLFKQFWSYFLVNSILRVLKKEKIKFDLIHAHGSLPDDHTALLLSKKTNIPFLITVHGETIFSLLRSPQKFSKSREAILEADAVVGVSDIVVERIKKFTNRKDDVFKVLNGYKIPKIKAIDADDKRERIEILFAATLIERKGCEYLVQAFSNLVKKYENIHLTIVGGGELFKKIKNSTLELGRGDEITMTGVQDHDKVLKYMSGCDIFVLPSWDEAFGVVYLEAMSFQKPVIGTIGQGISDIIIDGENGFLVPPRNIAELQKKIEYLILDYDRRKTMGANGFRSIQHLTWKNSAECLKTIYDSMIKMTHRDK